MGDRDQALGPLAQALAGSRAGAKVVWHRPVGDAALRVETIEP